MEAGRMKTFDRRCTLHSLCAESLVPPPSPFSPLLSLAFLSRFGKPATVPAESQDLMLAAASPRMPSHNNKHKERKQLKTTFYITEV